MRRFPSFRRIGCGILLVAWFLFLLTPCLLIVLATQQEIVLTHSDVPNDNLRIWLVQEAGQRGIGFSNSRRVDAPSNAVCTLTDVRFVLWEGKGEPNHYCSCYTRQNNEWTSIAEGADACKMAGE